MIKIISLSSKNIFLRPVTTDDISTLLNWRNDLSELIYWSGNRTTLTMPNYTEEINSDSQNGVYRFCIVNKSDSKVIGQIYAYGHNQNCRYAFIAMFIEEKYRNRTFAAEAFALMAYPLGSGRH